jgi:hypothetical protein
VDDGATSALRARSPDLLRSALVALLRRGEKGWLMDGRDLLVALAPYYDCACRLDLDPISLFDEAAAAGPRRLRETVSSFGRRDDITLEAFGFALLDEADGPRYDWVAR